MASAIADVLGDVVQTLRQTGKFRLVTLGGSGSSPEVPRAEVLYEGQELFIADDSAASCWMRIAITLSIRARSTDAPEAVSRICQLCEQATDALLQDPFRGSRCRHLPIGQATEVGRTRLSSGIRRPEIQITTDIRCHLEVQETG